MGKFASDFKAFIAKGNVVDMAVGVVVGGAFNKIVTSLVNDIIMPLVSLLAGGLNVSDWKWVIRPAETAADGTQIAENALMYGNFIQTVLDFFDRGVYHFRRPASIYQASGGACRKRKGKKTRKSERKHGRFVFSCALCRGI